MCVKNSEYSLTRYSGRLMAGGIMTLIIVGGIYGMRLAISIAALKESICLRNHKAGVYTPQYNWFMFGITGAALRGAGMIFLIIISLIVYEPLAYLSGYFSAAPFPYIISASMNIGSIISIVMIDLCYIAFFVLFSIWVNVYHKALGISRIK